MNERDSASGGTSARGLRCSWLGDELPQFVARILEAQPDSEDAELLDHLDVCPLCAGTYGSLVQMLTATQVESLEKVSIDDRLQPLLSGGLLDAWRIQLGLRNLHDDLRGASTALTVMGMIHRQHGRVEDARVIHELALETDPKPSFTSVLSRTDLAHLALASGRIVEAVRQLSAGALTARRLGKQSAVDRVAALRSRWFGETARNLLGTFYTNWLTPIAMAESAGDRILVVNTGAEIPIRLWTGLEVDTNGRIQLAIGMDETTLSLLPATFVIDLLFIPTGDLIGQLIVGADERSDLRAHGGLTITADLPGGEHLIEPLRRNLQAQPGRRQLPRRACELRIWWEA